MVKTDSVAGWMEKKARPAVADQRKKGWLYQREEAAQERPEEPQAPADPEDDFRL